MRLKITHRTEYSYDGPLYYALQRLRLVPYSSSSQTVRSWTLAIEGAREEVRFADHFGNDTRLLASRASRCDQRRGSGEVETMDTSGIMGLTEALRRCGCSDETPLTTTGAAVAALAQEIGEGTDIERLHQLMASGPGARRL